MMQNASVLIKVDYTQNIIKNMPIFVKFYFLSYNRENLIEHKPLTIRNTFAR